MATFTVVLRCQARCYFRRDEEWHLTDVRTPFGRAEIVIRTHRVPAEGFTKPMVRGLMAEVRGDAPTIQDAVRVLGTLPQAFLGMLVLLTNATATDFEPEIAFESSDDALQRPFLQILRPSTPLLFVDRRPVDLAILRRFGDALAVYPGTERLLRAVAQYFVALQAWEPGREVLAHAHLWMAAEAMTPLVRDAYLRAEGIDAEALAARWQVDPKRLDGAVRLHLICAGDAQTYRDAHRARNGLQHGFLPLDEVRRHAEASRVALAGYVRTTILREVGLSDADVATLLGAPNDRPGHLRLSRYIFGTLEGPRDHLAAHAERFPLIRWFSVPSERARDGEQISIQFADTMELVLGEGMRFLPDRVEVWGDE